VVLGHELLDNLPFRLVREDMEVRVDADGGRLVDVLGPLPPDLASLADAHDDEVERTVPTGAVALIHDLAPRLSKGYALFVDYGGDGGAGGPVHGYRGHRVVEDVLAHPGTTDITAGVDFGILRREAATLGLAVFPTTRQHLALASLGFERWMREELATQGALLNEERGMEAVRRWTGRSRASILVSPNQLGRMCWWGLASSGLPRPSFLTDGSV
jgi:SAM-dependent MidA family methyltransferase